MGFTDELTQAEISMFERGIRVPPLPVLLEYSRAANVYLELLVSDELDLPPELPAPVKIEIEKRPKRTAPSRNLGKPPKPGT